MGQQAGQWLAWWQWQTGWQQQAVQQWVVIVLAILAFVIIIITILATVAVILAVLAPIVAAMGELGLTSSANIVVFIIRGSGGLVIIALLVTMNLDDALHVCEHVKHYFTFVSITLTAGT